MPKLFYDFEQADDAIETSSYPDFDYQDIEMFSTVELPEISTVARSGALPELERELGGTEVVEKLINGSPTVKVEGCEFAVDDFWKDAVVGRIMALLESFNPFLLVGRFH